MSNKRADLHIHTSYSDGACSPEKVVEIAQTRKIDIISITDHDSVNGIAEAIAKGKEIGVEVIPGVELSTDIEDKEVHLLGYFIDYEDTELKNISVSSEKKDITELKELSAN